MKQQYLFIFRSGPYKCSRTSAGVDLMLTAATFDQQVMAAFIEDGILLLLNNQDSSRIGLKNLSQAFPALELYDIDRILVDNDDLARYQLESDQLLIPVAGVSQTQLGVVMDKADQVFVF
ncbi:MAG: sulfurtransferase complex subunit TusC [Pseudohongiellaceae bacterium]